MDDVCLFWVFLIFIFVAPHTEAAQQLYRCKQPNGTYMYTVEPCPDSGSCLVNGERYPVGHEMCGSHLGGLVKRHQEMNGSGAEASHDPDRWCDIKDYNWENTPIGMVQIEGVLTCDRAKLTMVLYTSDGDFIGHGEDYVDNGAFRIFIRGVADERARISYTLEGR